MIKLMPSPFRNEFTEDAYYVYSDERLLMEVGFKVQSLLSRTIYMWVRPRPALKAVTKTQLRELRKELEAFGSATLIANIFCNDATAIRFARFFGFKPIQLIGERLVMKREVN